MIEHRRTSKGRKRFRCGCLLTTKTAPGGKGEGTFIKPQEPYAYKYTDIYIYSYKGYIEITFKHVEANYRLQV